MSIRRETPIIDVVYDNVEGWHRFTSPELPELLVLVTPNEYDSGTAAVSRAIETLVESEKSTVRARELPRQPTCECEKVSIDGGIRPRVLRYAIEPATKLPS